jgi:tetratricopeptide (TPR) repeat protein
MARQDSGDAMRLWKHSLTLNANDISARMNLGVMYLKYRLLSQASAQFERILKVAPNHQDAKLHLAIIDGSRGNHEQSIKVYQQILAGDKENPLALYNLAVSQKALEQYDDSLDSIKKYIKASPGKSAQTDQAFALIEDITYAKQSKGQKVSDSEIRSLAAGLENKRPATKTDQSQAAAASGDEDKEPATTAQTKLKGVQTDSSKQSKGGIQDRGSVDLGADKDADELERELKAH